jgi:hypothetical protein
MRNASYGKQSMMLFFAAECIHTAGRLFKLLPYFHVKQSFQTISQKQFACRLQRNLFEDLAMRRCERQTIIR